MNEIPQGSNSFRKLNPHLFALGAVEIPERKQSENTALERHAPAEQKRKSRLQVRVTIVGYRRRIIDDDNFSSGGNKALRDAIAEEVGIDDGDPRIKFEYGQIETRGTEGTSVMIEIL
jgi:hypothetical protein